MTRQHSQLDPRDPFVLDTRELGRRAGSLLPLDRVVAAPADLATEMMAVREGSELRIAGRLESVVEGVLVTAHITGRAEGECGRCLDPVTEDVHVRVQELFAYPDSTTAESSDDDEVLLLDGDYIDLEPLVRDAIVLQFPLSPLCRADCQGLCAGCGIRLDEAEPGHAHDVVDPRWAALQALADEHDPIKEQ